VDAIDERSLLASLHKIANRITVGLLLAALIVGAALMMRVSPPSHSSATPASPSSSSCWRRSARSC
jgi:ubiquinone biosynthesis protein